jgi:hypothetical protein
VKPSFKQIREKENLQNGKHDKQLDKDDYPQLFSHLHASETVVIKKEDFM